MMKNSFTKCVPAILLLAALFPNIQAASGPASHTICKKSKLFTAQSIVAWSAPAAGHGFFYKSGLAIDADGAARAYHPQRPTRTGFLGACRPPRKLVGAGYR